MEIRIAITKLMGPVKPNSMDSVAPSRPDTMPSGRPKFRPQPEWIMGTMASTRTAFQLKRLMVLVIWVARSGAHDRGGDKQQQQEARDDDAGQSEIIDQLPEFRLVAKTCGYIFAHLVLLTSPD